MTVLAAALHQQCRMDKIHRHINQLWWCHRCIVRMGDWVGSDSDDANQKVEEEAMEEFMVQQQQQQQQQQSKEERMTFMGVVGGILVATRKIHHWQ